MSNDLKFRATMDDKVSGTLDRMRDKFATLGKSQGFKSVAQGVGMGIGISAWGLLDRAIAGSMGVLGDAVAAAEEEEVSIAKLDAALKANVAGWNGNTDAIESLLTARMKLGFSDDEQRQSLATLLAATHDVNRALEIERTAMDLARFKGISLGDATDALTKVEAGSYRILKSLGIVLKDGATQTEALAAVQAVAQGQAESYAATNQGKLLVSQVRVGEAMERLGKSIMPIVAQGMEIAASAIENLIGTLTALIAKVQQAIDWLRSLNVYQQRTEAMDRAHLLGQDNPHRAAGGPVWPGQAYTVGERGPETLVMGRSGGGYVTPHGGGGGGDMVANVYLDSDVLARAVFRRANQKARLSPRPAL